MDCILVEYGISGQRKIDASYRMVFTESFGRFLRYHIWHMHVQTEVSDMTVYYQELDQFTTSIAECFSACFSLFAERVMRHMGLLLSISFAEPRCRSFPN